MNAGACDPTVVRLPDNTAIISIGANLGDPVVAVRNAIASLQQLSSAPVRASSLWDTTPVDCPPGSPRFINAVAVIELQIEPGALLAVLQQLEQTAGRTPKTVLNEPRPLDLDLVAFGARKMNTPELTLPHPRAHLRRFVLEPLAELLPNLVLPGRTESVRQLLDGLPADPGCSRLPL